MDWVWLLHSKASYRDNSDKREWMELFYNRLSVFLQKIKDL